MIYDRRGTETTPPSHLSSVYAERFIDSCHKIVNALTLDRDVIYKQSETLKAISIKDYYCFTRLPGGRRYLLVVLVVEDNMQCSLPMDTFHAILLI